MIITLTLNPCIDQTTWVEGLEIGGTNRVKKVKKEIGGKGINVSTALIQLGYQTQALVFTHEQETLSVEGELCRRGITCESITVPGELRTNLKVFDCEKKEMTEFNERGSAVSEEAAEQMIALIETKLSAADVLVVCGSVPPGVSSDYYYRIVEMANKAGVLTILDADNALFAEALKAKPTLIKPNRGELERYLGRKVNSEDEIIDAAKELVKSGIPYICVSVGADGAYLICADCAYHTKGAKIEVRGVQGAGDSLVAGFAIGLSEEKSPEESLKLAVACANGSLTYEGTGMCRKEDVKRLIEEIRVRRVR